MPKLKKIPSFKSEKEENEFWQKVDLFDYVDFSKGERWSFPNLKLTSKPITLRIQESVLNRVRMEANKLDMPYQTLIKQYILKGLGLI